MELQAGDLVLCTVERIEKTIVFVKVHHQGKELDGTIVTSEISPGRIRNIRNYVVPKKKIVCKVLRVSKGNIELSLRRVTQKEKKEVLERYSQEKSYKSIFKTILKEYAERAIKEIEKNTTLYDFIEEAKKSPEILEKIIGKEKAEKILKIIKTEKTKKASIKKEFLLTTKNPDGVKLIKNILKEIKKAEIKYLSAGKYSIKLESDNLKQADIQINEILKNLEEKAEKHNMDFKVIPD